MASADAANRPCYALPSSPGRRSAAPSQLTPDSRHLRLSSFLLTLHSTRSTEMRSRETTRSRNKARARPILTKVQGLFKLASCCVRYRSFRDRLCSFLLLDAVVSNRSRRNIYSTDPRASSPIQLSLVACGCEESGDSEPLLKMLRRPL